MSLDLLSNMNRVETPFIIAEIGGVTFGVYDKNVRGNILGVTYPNFMKSLTINKVNGTVNTYNLQLVYAITAGDDPNLLEKIFSKARNDRTIYLSYGDLSMPTYIYKREKAMIIDIKSNIDFRSSKINYTINCVSSSALASSANFNFPKRFGKPSDIIKELLYSNTYGLLEIFYGMKDKSLVLQNNLIASDDAAVTIEAKTNITPIQYIQYLVDCMIPNNQSALQVLNSAVYKINVVDDVSGVYEGPYFKIVRIADNIQKDSIDVFTVDIGYPDKSVVLDFSINDSEAYSIFYEYTKDVKQPEYIQRIDNQGNLISEYSPAFSNSDTLLRTTSEDKTWWTNMVNFPITATLRIKGLIKPAILMSYIYIDARFFGREHYSSGYYVITKQTDEISAGGYRTTLTLLRTGKVFSNDN